MLNIVKVETLPTFDGLLWVAFDFRLLCRGHGCLFDLGGYGEVVLRVVNDMLSLRLEGLEPALFFLGGFGVEQVPLVLPLLMHLPRILHRRVELNIYNNYNKNNNNNNNNDDNNNNNNNNNNDNYKNNN